MDAVFITDLHIAASSRVRSGELVPDLKRKLQFVVNYCNDHDCCLLLGGDIFDKPSVPDFVKTELAPVLMQLKNPCWAISGNHDRLYDNPEYLFKTSYQVWCSHGIMNDLDAEPFVDMGDWVLSSRVPIIDRGKPQVFMFHGFLNVEDGRNTFRFTDIETTQPCYILLGHDHVVYEPLEFKPGIKIFRPGSFLRGTRQDTNKRIPQLMHIHIVDGKLRFKMVDIDCRDWEEIFKPKQLKITKAQQSETYDDIINQIRNAHKVDLTLQQALEQVAEPDVVLYCMNTLQECRQDKTFKKL